MASVGYIHMTQTGYINKVAGLHSNGQINNEDYEPEVIEGKKIFKVAIASEKGMFIGEFKGSNFFPSFETKLIEGTLVSCCVNLGNNLIMYSLYNTNQFIIANILTNKGFEIYCDHKDDK